MNEYESLQRMNHQEYLLRQNGKRSISKWHRAKQIIKEVIPTLSVEKEKNMITALKLACQALVKAQAEEENPPLKKIALDDMNGEPVWVVSYNHDGRWGIVETSDQSVIFYEQGEIKKECWFDGRYIFRYKKEIIDYTEQLEKYNIKEDVTMKNVDFTEFPDAQDMIRIVMDEKKLSPEEAVKFSVNRTIYQRIIKAGYASIALPLWGHDDPERERKALDKPIGEVEFDKLSQNLINDIMEKEEVEFEIAVSYFLLFTMEALGYHI
jgi:hypothetical protein